MSCGVHNTDKAHDECACCVAECGVAGGMAGDLVCRLAGLRVRRIGDHDGACACVWRRRVEEVMDCDIRAFGIGEKIGGDHLTPSRA